MLPPGTVVGKRYRITRLLDEGGMGLVYQAEDLTSGSGVALKLIKSTVAADPLARMRLAREFEVLSRVESDTVVRALAADVMEDGSPYLVMELLAGRDLRRECRRRGPLPIAEAVAYVAQACRGVAVIHSHGIVHRDLKPHNLFITNLDGARKIKILDFGIAKWSKDDPSVTATNSAVGTPLYMSPEQLRDPGAFSEVSDVWSLGAILYELLVGFAPFSASSASAVIAAVLSDAVVPLHSLRPDVPDALDDVVRRALAKDPAQRWQSAKLLEAALLEFAQPEPVIVPEPLRTQRSSRVVSVADARALRAALRPQVDDATESAAPTRIALPEAAETKSYGVAHVDPETVPWTGAPRVSTNPGSSGWSKAPAAMLLGSILLLTVGGLAARAIHSPSGLQDRRELATAEVGNAVRSAAMANTAATPESSAPSSPANATPAESASASAAVEGAADAVRPLEPGTRKRDARTKSGARAAGSAAPVRAEGVGEASGSHPAASAPETRRRRRLSDLSSDENPLHL